MSLHWALAIDKPLIAATKRLRRKCQRWKTCQTCCPENAIEIGREGLTVDQAACVSCFACLNLWVNMGELVAAQRFDHLLALVRRIADSALGAMKTKRGAMPIS
jgi:uncharacterized Fe-S center protein